MLKLLRSKLPVLLLWLLVTILGCGSPVVDAGRSRPPANGAMTSGVGTGPNRNTPAIPSSANWNNLEHIPASRVLTRPAGDAPAVYHEVQTGETMQSIAAKYGVTAQSLTKANGLDANSGVQSGQLLFIPPVR